MERWLKRILGKHVQRGRLRVLLGPQRSFMVGDGTGKPITIAFDRPATLLWILTDPDLRLGEAFMDGSFRVTEGSLADFLDLVESQSQISATFASLAIAGARYLGRRAAQLNHRRRARRNVHHHYDLDGRLYSLFLDADRQYSCAYFEDEGTTLDDAQIAKRRHLAAKLLMDEPGLRVLDIGSGWGGLGLYLSEIAGAKHVTGITLSDEQVAAARARVAERGLKGRVEFRLQDYRDVDESFDRIVSVGMF
ncbi:MAG TPA: class I SAM-dependent methyltransferase, partial [Xanthobacteraceae bacterium]|nr:class I SAM-dependent methyltransferase [Xanthobacteraceae bacterium]